MRRLVPFAVAALVVLTGCGTQGPDRAGPTGVRATSTSAPSPAASPAPTPAAEGARGPLLTDFPLALELPAENGDDQSAVAVSGEPASRAFDLCGVPTWDPRAGTTEVLGVEFRGEAEWSIGRTLVSFPDATAAESAVTAAHDAVAGCPDEPRDAQMGTTHTIVPTDLGDQAVVWTDTFYTVQDGEQLHDTGLVVFVLVRVGRSVLLTYEYGEGNGSPQGRADAVAGASDAVRPLVQRMTALTEEQPAGAAGIPDDFPLGAGLSSDGETTVEGPGADVPGAYLEDLCGFTGWPGADAGRVDRLAVRQSGPEFLVVRELVAHDSDGSATAVLDQLRDQVDGCTRADGQVVTSLDEEVEPEAREDSVTYAMTYRQGLGGTVVQVTRAGHVLLATTWGGEYSLDSATEAVPALTRTSRELLGRLTGRPDATGVTVTPEGAAPFRRDMTPDEARTAADGVRIESPGSACPQLSWTDASGVELRGTFSPGSALGRAQSDCRMSRISSAVSDGVLPTLTPTASRASFLAAAVPDEPETMAPAWPMVLPSGAVKPAT
jgi:hypothetical protein